MATESLRPNTTTPAGADNDGLAINVGVQWASSVAGQVTHHRAYLPATAGVTYTGRIYAADRTVLAAVVYPDDTAGPGWVEVAFASPVDIDTEAQYWTALHSDVGDYVFRTGAFPFSRGHLTALGGAFGYGGLAFPSTMSSVDFFPDVVFAPSVEEETNDGVIAGVLPRLTGTLAGGAQADAVLAAQLPRIAGAITGDATVDAVLAGMLPMLRGGFSDQLTTEPGLLVATGTSSTLTAGGSLASTLTASGRP